MLTVYHPETEDELCLAAQIISFSFHPLEALGQAAAPDMPLTRVLRLRGSAVSLSRESHKAQRRLDKLQAARRAGIPVQPAEPLAPSPKAEKAIALIADTRKVAETAKTGKLTWTQAYNQRQRETNLAARQQKNAAKTAAILPAVAPTAQAAALTG
jgi:hypothetical protein